MNCTAFDIALNPIDAMMRHVVPIWDFPYRHSNTFAKAMTRRKAPATDPITGSNVRMGTEMPAGLRP